MNITSNVTPGLNNKFNGCEGVSVSNLASKNIRGRDVVVLNPYCAGVGDEALAKK